MAIEKWFHIAKITYPEEMVRYVLISEALVKDQSLAFLLDFTKDIYIFTYLSDLQESVTLAT